MSALLEILFVTIPAFVVVIFIIVLFHELGHFLVGRAFGTKVDAFAIGFGPEITGVDDRHGTRWKLCWIPLGGYVKFSGDENAASMPSREKAEELRQRGEDPDSLFFFKPLYQRAAIVAAGPAASFLLAIVIFAGLAMTVGERVISPRVDQVLADAPAEAAGVLPGDVIVSINGRQIDSFQEMQQVVSLSPGVELTFRIRRDGDKEIELPITPERVEAPDGFGGTQRIGRIGIQHDAQASDVRHVRYDPLTAIAVGTERTKDVVVATVSFLGGLFSGTQSTDQLGGPVRIAEMSGDIVSSGTTILSKIVGLLSFAAVLSASIGFFNLLPIPILDGGHLMYYAYEAVVGKPMPERIQDLGFRIGLAMVLALMIFATWNDTVGRFLRG